MQPKLPVLRIVLDSWRFMRAHPGAVLRTGWLPTIVLFGLAAKAAALGQTLSIESIAGMLGIGLATLALLIVTLVAWQRLTLFGADHRKGLTPLRLGRAEAISILHFPLFLVLLMPMLIAALTGWILAGPGLIDGGLAGWLPYIAFGVLVFPGGLLLTRAALMLAAIAAAGQRKLSVIATANNVWTWSAGNTVRIFLAIVITGLPVAIVSRLFNDLDRAGWNDLLVVAADLLHIVLLVAYIMLVGGTLARLFEALGGMEKTSKAKTKAKTRPKGAR